MRSCAEAATRVRGEPLPSKAKELCLCSLHHKLFDKGVLGIGDGHRILVSQQFIGRSQAAREHVTALAGRPLMGPQPGTRPIAEAHRSWHTSQVFHGSPRPTAA